MPHSGSLVKPDPQVTSEGLQLSSANKTLRLHRTQRDHAVLQMRTTFVALKTIFVSVCLLWFSDQTRCWSKTFTWLGLAPAQVRLAALTLCLDLDPKSIGLGLAAANGGMTVIWAPMYWTCSHPSCMCMHSGLEVTLSVGKGARICADLCPNEAALLYQPVSQHELLRTAAVWGLPL